MSAPDPRWLEILKASSGQTLAIAVGLGILLAGIHFKMLPDPGAPWVVAIAAGALISGCLTVTAVASAAYRSLSPLVDRALKRRAYERGVQEYLPFMTPAEKAIIAHLLHHRQKVFPAAVDGGHAATLLARGIILVAARPGQVFDPENVPMAVHDLAWKVFERHAEAFPYQPSSVDPWRVHWMAR